VGPKLRTGARLKSEFERLVDGTLGGRPISEIKRSEVVALMDKIEAGELKTSDGKYIEGGPVAADRTFALIRRIFNWHAGRADDFKVPAFREMERRSNAKERARERVLTDAEIKAVWDHSTEGAFPLLCRFLLLTTARRNEAAEMRFNEIRDGAWTLPASRNKVKVDLPRPLSEPALAVIEALRRDDGSEYVFASADGRRPMSAFGRLKRKFDKDTGTSGWTLHDLRRTARTLMSRAGVDSDVAERALGHVIGGVRGVYDRHRYLAEMKRAYDALAALIERIVNPPSANVHKLRR
jgi:integrase